MMKRPGFQLFAQLQAPAQIQEGGVCAGVGFHFKAKLKCRDLRPKALMMRGR
jgi:hypothetical protein